MSLGFSAIETKLTDLVFTTPLGAMMNPNYLSESFSLEVKAAGLKPVTFHGLRHTHCAPS